MLELLLEHAVFLLRIQLEVRLLNGVAAPAQHCEKLARLSFK